MPTLGPLSAVRVAAPQTASAVVVFLHGLGDSGEGWSFLPAEAYQRSSLQHIDFVLPNAPVREITAFGQKAPGWFDVMSFDGRAGTDEQGILAALGSVQEIVDREIARGIPPERIIVGGFSQGCALTEGTAVTIPNKLAGFIAVSGYIPIPKVLEKQKSEKNVETPMLMLHGTADQIVPFKMGVTSREILASPKFGLKNIEWHEYPRLAHSIAPEGVTSLLDFLERNLPPQ